MIRVAAHAKINLYLHVVGRRPDGYHRLDSLVVFADLHDDLVAAPADALSLDIDGPFAPALTNEADNLVLRAARGFAEAVGRAPNVRFTLTKRIPVSAGIGGGSADAAAALRALAALWGEKIPSELPITLGADVPCCLASRPLFLAGIGEALHPAPRLPPSWLLLVNPGVAVSTKDVFTARSGAFSHEAHFEETPLDAAHLARLLLDRGNDLTAAAITRAPEIEIARSAIERTRDCLLARMSGSGATVFGFYASEEAAAAARGEVARAHPTWWRWSGAIGDAQRE